MDGQRVGWPGSAHAAGRVDVVVESRGGAADDDGQGKETPGWVIHFCRGKVILGVTGGIAAYKAADLCSKLVQAGAEVDVILTDAAARFVAPLTFAALERPGGAGRHVDRARRRADPARADGEPTPTW